MRVQFQQAGFSLLEMMAVIAIIAVISIMGFPLIQNQSHRQQLDLMAQRFILHAQFARQQAMVLNQPVAISPRLNGVWNLGWKISAGEKILLEQYSLVPIQVEGGGKGSSEAFIDPHLQAPQILFNPSGSAKTKHGGFVANRLILRHRDAPKLQRHLILAASGRWRICDPQSDRRGCY